VGLSVAGPFSRNAPFFAVTTAEIRSDDEYGNREFASRKSHGTVVNVVAMPPRRLKSRRTYGYFITRVSRLSFRVVVFSCAFADCRKLVFRALSIYPTVRFSILYTSRAVTRERTVYLYEKYVRSIPSRTPFLCIVLECQPSRSYTKPSRR